MEKWLTLTCIHPKFLALEKLYSNPHLDLFDNFFSV